MDNTTIFVIVGVIIIVVLSRKWDTIKWVLGLAVVILGIWHAYKMGMFDALIPDVKTPTIDFK